MFDENGIKPAASNRTATSRSLAIEEPFQRSRRGKKEAALRAFTADHLKLNQARMNGVGVFGEVADLSRLDRAEGGIFSVHCFFLIR